MSFHIPPALRHRRYALLWFGLLISVSGSQMQVAAILWHVSILTRQPIAVSGIGLFRFLPIVLLALIGGVVADSYNRRKILFITQSVMTLTALMLGLLTVTGVIQVWHIYLLTAVQAAAMAFDLPARQALLPNLVPRKDLTSALSMSSIAFNTGAIVGPMLSGFVIGGLGMHWVYIFNAISFLAVLAALWAMGPVEQEYKKTSGPKRVIDTQAIGEGIAYIKRQPVILSSMILDFFATFFSSANTLLPFVAQNILRVGEQQYGLLVAAQSVGAVATGLYLSQKTNLRRQGMMMVGAVTVFGLATIWFGLAASFLMTFLALILVGAADTVSTILRNTIRQILTPDEMRGRMISINQIFFQGGPQLGEIEAGAVAQAFGVPWAIISGGIGCVVAVGLIGWRWPQLLAYNGEEKREPQLKGGQA